jgi:OmpA-OmpF porin, OOP family
MTRFSVLTLIVTGAMLTGGCATKKFVRQTTAPVQAKVDQVGEQTAKHAEDIQETRSNLKEVDERAQSGISAAQERAASAEKGAGEAMAKANEANEAAGRNAEAVNSLKQTQQALSQVVTNLDDYRLQTEVTIPFRFDQHRLDPEATQELDNLAKNVGPLKRFFIAVEGYTDRSGSQQYNEALSRRRADAVVRYLVTTHDIPVYRIHMIGLGSEKPVEDAATRAARARNRRVEVKLFSADQAFAQLEQGGAISQR